MASAFAASDPAAAAAEVTHQVAGVLVGSVDFDMHDGFEERGARLLHGFLEGQRACNFECHVRRVDIVIFAVVEDGAEVHNGESRQEAAGSGVADAFLDGGNPVLGDGAAKDVVDELDALAALDRLHLDAANAELAVAARLLLVLAFDVGFAADGFTVRDFGWFESEIDMVALVELGDDDFNVLLAGAGQQKFLGLRIAGKAERGIFLQDFMNRDADLVFVSAGFGLDSECNRRLRQRDIGILNGLGLVAQGIAGECLF